MRVLTTLTVSGGLNLSSNAKDTFSIGTPLENNDGLVDDLYVYANADFKNNVILGSSSVDIVAVSGSLVLNPVAQPPTSREGQLYYDSSLHSLMLNTEVANVPLRLGRTLAVRAKNTDAVTLTKGMAVRIGAPQGANKTFVRALSVNIPLTGAVGNQIIGIIADNIAVNGFGYAVTFGELEGLNTVGLIEGNEIYVSSVTSGSLTGSRPTAPNEIIPIGICLAASANQGKIFVKSRDPVHFGDITGFNPDIASLQDGQVIRYQSSDGTWGNSNSGVKLTGSFSGTLNATTITSSAGVFLNNSSLNITGGTIFVNGQDLLGGGGGGGNISSVETTGSGESIVRDVNNGTAYLRSLKSTSTINVLQQTDELEFEVNSNLTLTSLNSQGTLVVSGNVQLGDSSTDTTTINGILKLNPVSPVTKR